MQLLVSVRSQMEVEPALAGGADVIDAKEPERGSLGAVTPEVLASIARVVPSTCPLSVALGDLRTPEEVAMTMSGLAPTGRVGPVYVKIGFAGVRSDGLVARLLESAVASALGHRVVAVAYADAERAESAFPEVIASAARAAGAYGVLLDTYLKDGRGLLSWLGAAELSLWVGAARGDGLATALAGGLVLADLEAIAAAGPDVVGVRGAACEGGRHGRLSAQRVRRLKDRLSGFGETRDHGANSALLRA